MAASRPTGGCSRPSEAASFAAAAVTTAGVSMMEDSMPATRSQMPQTVGSSEPDRVRPPARAFASARSLSRRELIDAPKFMEFLTVPAYRRVIAAESAAV